jgi:hypothetical protein
MKLHALALATAAVLGMGAAQADTIALTGAIALTDPTFNRPFLLGTLSSVGTAVHYDAFSFIGVSPGTYSFTMVSGPVASFDTFLALYAGGFNPAAPLSNLMALNDDLAGSLTTSGFTFTLVATTVYTVVSTAYSNTGVGNYTTTITSTVPEPESYALFAVGLIGMTAWLRKRHQQA